MKKIQFCLVILTFFCSLNSFSQGEIDDEQKMAFKNERTFLPKITTTSWSFAYSFAKRIDGYRYKLYSIEFAEINHPKEQKEWNSERTSRYIFGKENAFFALRASIGRQNELFGKFDKGSIAIRYYYQIGASLGIMKPIYYDIRTSTSDSHPKKFAFPIVRDNILGKSSIFLGMDEIMFSPGGHATIGFSFENSKRDETVSALEVGATIDVFSKPIEIMATQPSDIFFVTLFIAYRFGSAIRLNGSQE